MSVMHRWKGHNATRARGANFNPCCSGFRERNRFGLYDLRGNVAEYLIDLYPNSESQMIVGASWLTHLTEYYSVRNKSGFSSPDDKSIHVGFRCVLILDVDNQ